MVAVFAIFLAVAALGVLDVANLYLAKRSLQNVADLAALAAVQQMDDQCVQPRITALANAASNGFTADGSTSTLTVQCGRWDSSSTGVMSFVTTNPTSPLNGAAVTVSTLVPYFFLGPKHPITTTATAKASVIGSFQVGTSLAQVNLLNGLLSSLLGGTSVTLDAVSWNGIANANVKISDLAAVATQVGTYDGLLAAQTSLTGGTYSLANVLLNAVQKDGALTADVSAAQGALKAIAALVPQGSQNTIKLASLTSSTQALLQLGVANAQYAADAQVNVLQMLIAGAEIAAAGQSPVALNVSLSGLSGLLPASLGLTLQVISPPSLAVGEPGLIAGTSTWRTQATTAQIVLGVNIGVSTQQIPLLGSVIGLNIQLPFYVVVAQGSAWLQSAQCAATLASSTQTIGVRTGVANVCVGTAPSGITGNTLSSSSAFSCTSTDARWAVASVSILGVTVASITAPAIDVPVVNASSSTLMFDGNGNALAGNSVNSNQIGAVLTNTLQSLLTQLGQLTEGPNGLVFKSQSGITDVAVNLVLAVVGGVLDTTVIPALTGLVSTVLAPLLSALDTVLLGPLLQLLGVQIGVATVTDYPLACGVATLVQ